VQLLGPVKGVLGSVRVTSPERTITSQAKMERKITVEVPTHVSGVLEFASGELAYHALDIMHAFHDSSSAGKRVTLESSCARPAPLPLGLRDGVLDA